MGLSRSGFGFVIVLLLLVVVVIPTGFSVAAASDASCSSSSSSSAIPIAPNPNPDPADSPSASASAATSSRTRTRILPDVTGAIGRTPLVCLSRIAKHYGIDPSRDGTILAKLEYLSPGSSKKDRIALSIIERARADGSLKPGQPVVELTSGNTGTGLAIVCGVLGHPFVAVMSKGNSEERAIAMRALGAEVVLVDQQTPDEPPNEEENEHFNGGSKSNSNSNNKNYGRVSGADLDLVDRKAREITTALCAFRADQFVRASNKEAHLYGTGPELWADSGGSITDFCDFVGTGGSFGGIAEYLKKQNPSVKCYIVEPEAAAVLREEALGKDQKAHPNHLVNAAKSGGHKIQGGGYSKSRNELPMIDDSAINNDDEAGDDDDDDDEDNVTLVDGYLTVSDDEAIAATRALARWEGIFGGFSGGANFVAAVKLLKKRRAEREQEGKPESSSKPAVVAILICDSGLKYLSTDLWEGSE